MELPQEQPVNLWTHEPPLAHGNAPEDIPTITAYYPAEWRKNKKAVVILPGGAY